MLHLKGKEKGPITKDQKFKGLTERWYTSSKGKVATDDDGGVQYIKRNTHVTINVTQGKGKTAV